MTERHARTQASHSQDAAAPDTSSPAEALPWDDATPSNTQMASQALTSREDIAKAARLSSSQMVMIEKIQKQATPEVVAAVKSGVISINAVAAVSSLPAQEQVAAAAAGKDELKQAAKRVRDAKRKPRDAEASTASEGQDASDTPDATTKADEVKVLQKRVAVLQAENDALRKQVLNLLSKRGGSTEAE